ncbi:hypothetical protein DFH09DRAFT_1311343 [Mycena vulgaris]|nr:hypothetical protein DFH09DRAFT_1311343 [Mycena vulgaris]
MNSAPSHSVDVAVDGANSSGSKNLLYAVSNLANDAWEHSRTEPLGFRSSIRSGAHPPIFHSTTHHPLRFSSLTYSLTPSRFAPLFPIASVRLRTAVFAENELAAVEPLNFGSSLDAVLSVSINRSIGFNARSLLRPAPTPYRNNSDPPLYTTTGVHDAAAPNSLVYSPTHYRRSQRDIASPDAIPTLRRKPADAVIPTSGHTNTVPPPLPTQTEVPSASRCFSDSALQVWLNIDGQELVESTKQTTIRLVINLTDLKNGRALGFTHKFTTLVKTKRAALVLVFQDSKDHLDYGPRDRQSAPAVRDAETIVPKGLG